MFICSPFFNELPVLVLFAVVILVVVKPFSELSIWNFHDFAKSDPV